MAQTSNRWKDWQQKRSVLLIYKSAFRCSASHCKRCSAITRTPPVCLLTPIRRSSSDWSLTRFVCQHRCLGMLYRISVFRIGESCLTNISLLHNIVTKKCCLIWMTGIAKYLYCFSRHPYMLAFELIGRLLPLIADNDRVKMLVLQCDLEGPNRNCFLPGHHCFHSPGGPLKYSLEVVAFHFIN